MARVAAFSRRLAGQVRSGPMGRCRNLLDTAVLEKADCLSGNVCFHPGRTDRVWTRDSGCMFLTPPTDHSDSEPLALHFQFNAWAKYPNYKLDEEVGERMAQAAGA